MVLSTTPRIYVACLASYNSGTLHGRWIDCDQDADDIRAEIAEMLRESKYPNVEVECPDCEGKTGCPTCGDDGVPADKTPYDNVCGSMFCGACGKGFDPCETCKGTGMVPSAEEWAVHDQEGFDGWALGEHPDLDKIVEVVELADKHGEAVFAWIGHDLYNLDCPEKFEDAYRGEYKDVEEYAEQLLDDIGTFHNAPDILKNYFDYEKFARDLEIGGDIYTVEADGGNVYIFDSHA